MVKEFVKSNHGPNIHDTNSSNSFMAVETQVARFDMNQLFGFKIDSKVNNPQNNITTPNQLETSDQKFKRLMRQSEESLNRAKKII